MESASFDLESARPAMDESLACEVKMSINIPAPDDGELAVNRQGLRSVEKARAVHIQVMRIREEDEHLGEDLKEALNPKDRIAFLPMASQMKEVFFGYSRPVFPSPLGMNAGVRSL
uniref:Uncharacterized protein n=1 Tax=Picea sitchensis TaxID=3332 RepID=A9NLS8_PICSI|nr:unknown [Picea sitchensis]